MLSFDQRTSGQERRRQKRDHTERSQGLGFGVVGIKVVGLDQRIRGEEKRRQARDHTDRSIRPPAACQRESGPLTLSDTTYFLIGFRKSTFPENCQLDTLIRDSKQ